MRNIQNRYKRIKHINSFINGRLQRKLENLLKIHFQRPGSLVPLFGYAKKKDNNTKTVAKYVT